MTEQHRELARRLEQATTPPQVGHNHLDPETATLREGWLAFSQLLEAAAFEVEPPLPIPLALPPTSRWRKRTHKWLRPLGVLIALALLLGIIIVFGVPQLRRAREAIPGGHELAQNSHLSPDNRPAGAQSVTVRVGSEVAVDWEDTFDDELLTTTQAMAILKHDVYTLAETVEVVRYGLEQMAAEMLNNPL